MDIGNLDLSEAAWLCLGKLAMAVELDCGKRFAFRKAVDEIVGLLEAAEASVDAEIRRRKDDFLQVVSPGMQRLLSGRGLLAEPGERPVVAGEGPAQRYYRGARVGEEVADVALPREEVDALRYRGAKVVDASKPATPIPAGNQTAVDGLGRKRIVYRGKVIHV